MRDFQLPGRSPIRVTEAAASTSHPLATLTAIEVMKDGGNAIDAAVAAAAVLAVVEPQSTGIGGDCFVIFAPGGGKPLVVWQIERLVSAGFAQIVINAYTAAMALTRNEQKGFDAAVRAWRERNPNASPEEGPPAVATIICHRL